MTKNEINQIVKDYIRHNLSPGKPERERISYQYERLKTFVGGRTFLNGSYARFTSTTPVNDLDVIYELPEETYKRFAEQVIQPNELDINNILESLANQLENEYREEATIKVQPHSVGIFFGSEDDFSIDVVPAIPTGDGKYWVPESAHLTIMKRREFYSSLRPGFITNWIKSDPKGYKEQASVVDQRSNGNFRKTAKFVKKWKMGCKNLNDVFPLKSFHLELIVTRDFKKSASLSCLDALEKFYSELGSNIETPQFPGMADANRYVDNYLKDLTETQKSIVIQMYNQAKEILKKILKAERESEVLILIDKLLLIKKEKVRFEGAPVVISTSPAYSRPYCE